MAVRGSAIGASMGSSVFSGSVTGRAASPSTQALYPGNGAGKAAGGWGGVTLTLVLLVVLEAIALLSLRHGFRHHHGG